MPKYEDLEFIRDKILSIGDEINVKKKLGMSNEVLPIPQKLEGDLEEKENFEGLIDEIKEDFNNELIIENDVTETEWESQKKDEKKFDLFLETDKNEQLDNAFEDILKKEEKKDETTLQDSFPQEEVKEIDESFTKKNQDEEIDSGLEQLLGDLSDITQIEIKESELDFKDSEVKENFDFLSLDSNMLSENIEESLKELNGSKEENKEIKEEYFELKEDFITEDNALKDLTSDLILEKEEKKEEELLDFKDLDQLVVEKEKSNRAQLLEVKEEEEEEPPIDISNIEELFEEPVEIPLEKEEGEKIRESEESIEKISPIESFEKSFDFSDLDQFKVQEEQEESEEKKIMPEIQKEVQEVEEESIEKEKIKIEKPEKITQINKDEIELTEEQIKQILLSLSALPKEVNIKIAKEIVSNKYSDKQLKPLIDALLTKEKLSNIIRIYEKITDDKSLSKITTIKYTGEEFEERQKSFAYLFEKNILPILYRITAVFIFASIIVLLIINILIPTMRASHYYNMGKKNIDQKKFNEVEMYFERAYQIQPRYNEAVIYARKYRQNKRFLEAEKKYNLALRMKENRGLKLEIADFFRETKDYERAIRNYSELKQKNDKDIKVLLGLAKTYYDLAEEIPNKLDDAKELYYDVLDLDKNNKEALYGNLNIFIKQNNNEEILKHYNYIEKKFKKNIDPISYLNLAEYFIETNQIENLKNVLDKTMLRINNLKIILPEIDYLYSIYKNKLNLFNEEKIHLENALTKFEKIKKEKPDLFGSKKYQNLLSRIYNNLGENHDRFSKGNIEAEKYFIMSINTDPDYGKPYFNLANFELKYKIDMGSAKNNYLEAEKRGFSNDRLNYNLGWIYFKQEQYLESFKRINRLLEKYPENSNLKFFLGTIFYKLKNFEFAEGLLLETYNYFNNLKQIYYPLEMDVKEDKIIADMLFKISNNLGAAYQKKFENTKNSKYLVWATKYYSESMEFYDKLKESHFFIEESKSEELSEVEIKLRKFEVTKATQNLRMVLYPDAGKDEPIIFEDFSLEYESSL